MNKFGLVLQNNEMKSQIDSIKIELDSIKLKMKLRYQPDSIEVDSIKKIPIKKQ